MNATIKRYDIEANGRAMGRYSGANADDAIEVYARDSGYRDFETLASTLGLSTDAARAELAVCEVTS